MTLIVRSREAAGDEFVVDKIRHAEAIFFAGGDQWDYIRLWKDTPLAAAVQERIDAGYPVGGTSAGLAVLGEYYFSAEFDTVTSAEAMADRNNKKIALGRDFLKIRHLENLTTDSHFTARQREGRLDVFLQKVGVPGVVGRAKAHVHGLGLEPRHFGEGEAVELRK